MISVCFQPIIVSIEINKATNTPAYPIFLVDCVGCCNEQLRNLTFYVDKLKFHVEMPIHFSFNTRSLFIIYVIIMFVDVG